MSLSEFDFLVSSVASSTSSSVDSIIFLSGFSSNTSLSASRVSVVLVRDSHGDGEHAGTS